MSSCSEWSGYTVNIACKFLGSYTTVEILHLASAGVVQLASSHSSMCW